MIDVIGYELMRREAEEESWLKTRPVCDWCGEPIQEESAIYFDTQHKWLCDACADDFRRYTEDED